MTPLPLRALIVDDEPLARQRLQRLLHDHPDVAIVGEADGAAAAMVQLQAVRPDLLFLDVQMPGLDGFALAESLDPATRPFLVFVTAHAATAVQAFDADAVDFLVKPVDPVRLAKAVERARRARDLRTPVDWRREVHDVIRQALAQPGPAAPPLARFAVTIGRKIVYVPVEQVDWIESEGNYARLHAGRQTYLVRTTMQKLEEQLDPRAFVRIHRATIIRLERVKEVIVLAPGEHRVVLLDGTQLDVMRSYRDRLPG